MNQKTSKLLRSYARVTNQNLKMVKKEWKSTPIPKRKEVGEMMVSGLWSTTLREWRARHDLQQKEAAAVLLVAGDTYRGWECMKSTPAKHVRIALGTVMRNFQK